MQCSIASSACTSNENDLRTAMKLCMRCGINPPRLVRGRLAHLCAQCKHDSRAIRLNSERQEKLRHKKTSCEHCGFVALHPCQLDIDHIDGNRANNDPSNYRTLCSNCHRLKTQLQRDHSWSDSEPDADVVGPQLRLIK